MSELYVRTWVRSQLSPRACRLWDVCLGQLRWGVLGVAVFFLQKNSNPIPDFSIVRERQAAYIDVMKRLVHVLIATLAVVGILASPAVMAWTMPGESVTSDCALCEVDSEQSHAPAQASTCAVAFCGMTANIADSALELAPEPGMTPAFYVKDHPGRHLEGPDPFPPRVLI